ncbi:MAG: hypothetical protein PVH61_15650 [Candidatus Aminicenantes bacterium]
MADLNPIRDHQVVEEVHDNDICVNGSFCLSPFSFHLLKLNKH